MSRIQPHASDKHAPTQEHFSLSCNCRISMPVSDRLSDGVASACRNTLEWNWCRANSTENCLITDNVDYGQHVVMYQNWGTPIRWKLVPIVPNSWRTEWPTIHRQTNCHNPAIKQDWKVWLGMDDAKMTALCCIGTAIALVLLRLRRNNRHWFWSFCFWRLKATVLLLLLAHTRLEQVIVLGFSAPLDWQHSHDLLMMTCKETKWNSKAHCWHILA